MMFFLDCEAMREHDDANEVTIPTSSLTLVTLGILARPNGILKGVSAKSAIN